jgi:uncharacterized membrane protein YgdD (TMEM256/DUF423 family)
LRVQLNSWLFVAAADGFLAVGIGAFGAHALSQKLDAHALQIFETGVRYQMYHALALGLAALAIRTAGVPAQAAAWFFLAGTVLFSGSLYLLALTGTKTLGMVTPFGGLAFLIGWAALGWAALKVPV